MVQSMGMYWVCGVCAEIILGILIAILELFQNNLGIIEHNENNAGIINKIIYIFK